MNPNLPELTPAHRDLLHVLRAAVAGHLPDSPPADWAALLDLAHLHQVDQFLFPIVREWDSAFQPPEDLMLRWRTSFLSAAATYVHTSAQIAELLSALHAAQIRVVPLKGIWLAENIYKEGVCRPMSDIDILVPPKDLDRARSVFEELGYLTPGYCSNVEHDKHIRYDRPDREKLIELHWRLWRPESTTGFSEPDSDRIWEGLREEKLHGTPILVFSPERQLIYLAQHIQRHDLTLPLRAYLDLVLLSRCYEFDLPCLNEEALAQQVPFGAKFVLQVSFDICGGCPSEALASFLFADGAHEKERREAVCAAMQLTAVSQKFTPAMADCCKASFPQRLKHALSRVFVPSNEIHNDYSSVVHRFGLVAGYMSRYATLIRRRGRFWRNVALSDPALDSDLENFASREALGKWIHEQDGKCKDQRSEVGGQTSEVR